MELKLSIIKKLLLESIKNIDAGNSDYSEKELDDIIESLSTINRGIKRISKKEACEEILHCSSSSFDNYLKLGLIPPGHKEKHTNNLYWCKKDFDDTVKYRIKKYSNKQGL